MMTQARRRQSRSVSGGVVSELLALGAVFPFPVAAVINESLLAKPAVVRVVAAGTGKVGLI